MPPISDLFLFNVKLFVGEPVVEVEVEEEDENEIEVEDENDIEVEDENEDE